MMRSLRDEFGGQFHQYRPAVGDCVVLQGDWRWYQLWVWSRRVWTPGRSSVQLRPVRVAPFGDSGCRSTRKGLPDGSFGRRRGPLAGVTFLFSRSEISAVIESLPLI